jgi:SAM-dependent methyltransferase
MKPESCPACEDDLVTVDASYARCPKCDYWGSSLEPDVENTSAPETSYELVSYDHTRKANYAAILDLLAPRHAAGSRLLEIGCADGLFLQMARERGYAATGIEPNVRMMNGNPFAQDIRCGFFPEMLAGLPERYDIIALNCVFEHVPDVDAMIESFKQFLSPGGSVMINVPVSTGLMFRVARRLNAAGVGFAFDRIWQKGFVSPHVHYFAKHNLAGLFRKHGFELVGERGLALFSLGGLYARLSLDPNIRAAQRLGALAALYAYYPVSRLSPDARAFLFGCDGSRQPAASTNGPPPPPHDKARPG